MLFTEKKEWEFNLNNNKLLTINISGHTARVLCLTMSPDGTTVASAAADETIRLWKCFAVDKGKKETTSKPVKETSKLGKISNFGSIR